LEGSETGFTERMLFTTNCHLTVNIVTLLCTAVLVERERVYLPQNNKKHTKSY